MSENIDNSLRFADPRTAQRYPYACAPDRLTFNSTAPDPSGGGCWVAEVSLPELSAGTLIAPSYTQLCSQHYAVKFTLLEGDQQAELPWVPSEASSQPTSTAVAQSPLTGVSTHIDNFLLERPLIGATLRVELKHAPPADTFLCCISIRQQQATPEPSAEPVAANAQPLTGREQPARCLSQRQGPNYNRGGICSPTALAMALLQLEQSPFTQSAGDPSLINWPTLVSDCRDAATGLYGVWPLNLYRASRLGFLGGLELLNNADQANQALSLGLPIVASVRYAKDQLPGAPQPQTNGHLVLLHGLTPTAALVADPAAAATANVAQRYPRDAFLSSWLTHRGAAYLLLPKG